MDSAFTTVIAFRSEQQLYTIPPGATTYQSDEETVHRLIEDEFYPIEEFYSGNDFFKKTIFYQIFFYFPNLLQRRLTVKNYYDK
jgi:hypothetical protein